MFGRSITIFRLLGFEVKIDFSWILLALIITWSLAQGLFPYYFKNLTATTYWWMGIFGALGLFFSIVFHELSHSIIARRFGLPIKGITLFVFGGVAHMEEEPPSAKVEFLMAIAGPVSSIILGFVFYVLHVVVKAGGWSVAISGVIGYLAFINWILAGFNLLPAFPLDGGRVLRAALWRWKRNIKWATRIASRIGSVFGIVLIIGGVFQLFSGNVIGGIWWFMIGMFLQNAARMSYRQLITRQALEGEQVRNFLKPNPITVSPSISIEELVEDYIYKYHYKMFPIVENDTLIGCITTRQIRRVPKAEWKTKKVGDLITSCSTENVIEPDIDAIKALAIMNRTGNSRFMVVEGSKLIGILALKDIMKFLSVKLDLEGYEEEK